MIFLNSCSAGRGQIKRGEENISLIRGFLYGGSKNVTYSLYDIPATEETILFSEKFYSYIFNQGYSYTKALQQTQIEFIEADLNISHWTRTLIGSF